MNGNEELIARLMAGDLQDGEAEELLRRLKTDPEAIRSLGAHAALDGLLGVALEDEISAGRRRVRMLEAIRRSDRDDFVAGVQAKIRHRSWRNRSRAIAAMIVLGFSAWMISRPEKVGTVVRLAMPERADAALPEAGGVLRSGARLRFGKGLVELDMGGRGRMIVEGPADLELAGPMRSILRRGRVVMKVTEAGHGYRVETPKATITDLGTEFGVSVDEGQQVETHVLEGEVEAMPAGGGKILLRQNDALRFDGGGGRRIPADGSSFYTALPPLRTDRPAMIHWPLEMEAGHRDRAELRGHGGNNHDMVLHSMEDGDLPRATPGVFGSALSFDGKGGYAESKFPGIGGTEPRTVSFWVKVPEDFKLREGFGIVSWGQFAGANHGEVWQISINPLESEGPLGRLRVGAHGGQIIGETDLRDGRWHHVAVVLYQAERPDIGKHVLIYLDGELEPISRRALRELNTRTEDASHGVWLGRNVVYNASVPGHRHGGFFRGEVDEVFIFSGALTQAEVRALKDRNEPAP